jgi:hypothetical protein
LLSVAAIEVCLKNCIAVLVPDTKWLLENMPAPSVERLLRDYVPHLPARIRGKALVIPKSMLDEIKKAVQIRNRLVHAGVLSIDHDFLESQLRRTQDLLWLFDAMAGSVWAIRNIRGELRELFQ